jgi:hypothetical protein
MQESKFQLHVIMQAREERTVNALVQPGHRFLASPNFATLSKVSYR